MANHKEIIANTLTKTVTICGQSIGEGGEVETAVIGSGFVYQADGIVLTCAHVVRNRRQAYFVELYNKQRFPAQIVGVSNYADVAVLKITPDAPLPFVKIGKKPQVGDQAFAVGVPMIEDLKNTVTFGCISYVDRFYPPFKPIKFPLLQVNISAARGNSGGGLFDKNGSLIGINSFVADVRQSLSSTYLFSVQGEDIAWVVERILKTGKGPWRCVFGARVSKMTPNIASLYKQNSLNGLVVLELKPGGFASRVGLLEGDVVLAVGAVVLDDTVNSLSYALMRYEGQKTALHINRCGQQISLPIQPPKHYKKPSKPTKKPQTFDRFGFKLADLPEGQGVFVQKVWPNSQAALEGVMGGEEVILGCKVSPATGCWHKVPDIKTFRALMSQMRGETVLFKLLVRERQVLIALKA